jgi:hypothetical protein
MLDKWTLTYTDANGRRGTETRDNATAFVSSATS